MDSRLYKRGATLFLSNSVGQALAFLASVAIGRLLGPEAFGHYATVMAIAFVLGLVVEAGIETSLTREIASEPQRSAELLTASLWAKGLLGAVVASLLATPAVAGLLAPDSSVVAAVQLAGILVALNSWNASFSATFRAWDRMGYVLLINVTGLGVQLAGVVAVVLTFRNVNAIIAWLVAVQIIELAGGVLLFKRGWRAIGKGTLSSRSGLGNPMLPRAGARGALWALLRRSWPFALAGVLGALTLRIDLFLIEALRGSSEVGVYSVAMRLHELLGLAPNSFFAALFPAMAAIYGTTREVGGASAETYRAALRRMGLAGVVVALAGVLLADALVGLTFGGEYAGAASSLRLLSLLLLPLLLNRTTTVYLYATRREWQANAVMLLNLLVRAAFGYIFVSYWGAPGAAAANLLAESVVLVVYWRVGAMRSK